MITFLVIKYNIGLMVNLKESYLPQKEKEFTKGALAKISWCLLFAFTLP